MGSLAGRVEDGLSDTYFFLFIPFAPMTLRTTEPWWSRGHGLSRFPYVPESTTENIDSEGSFLQICFKTENSNKDACSNSVLQHKIL